MAQGRKTRGTRVRSKNKTKSDRTQKPPTAQPTPQAKQPSCEINGAVFIPDPAITYKHDYLQIAARIKRQEIPELDTYRQLILTDLWFVVFFVLKVPIANHQFVVDACREVEESEGDLELDLWAREHFKSTVITIGRTLQILLKNPSETVCFFSYTRAAAMVFLRQMKLLLEESLLLKACFPDVLWQDPKKDAPKWSESEGLCLRRDSHAKEMSLEAWGLIEGMPTARHFSVRVYDDVEVEDLVNTPELISKLKDAFDLSQNLGTFDGVHRVIGTHYHHEGLLAELRSRKKSDGSLMYNSRVKPATMDGTYGGEPVFMSYKRLEILKANKRHFYCQQLLDPTPVGERKLESSYLQDISPANLPKRLIKFMTVDPAGAQRRRDGRRGDAWAILTVGVEPFLDDIGASAVYILDAYIDEASRPDALEQICGQYLKHGRIERLGVEKTSMTEAEYHVITALRARGRYLTAGENLILLRPAGRKKSERIEAALSWPLVNSKLFISDGIPKVFRDRLRMEMDKFPYWHDDGCDALAYLYDMLKDFPFYKAMPEAEKPKPDLWERLRQQREHRRQQSHGWMGV